MLSSKGFSGFAVDDIERAQRFYGGTLGLRPSEDPRTRDPSPCQGGRARSSIRSPIPRRRRTRSSTSRSRTSRRPSTSSASAESGFERYEGFQQDEGTSHDPDGPPIAWFRDPANILSVLQNGGM